MKIVKLSDIKTGTTMVMEELENNKLKFTITPPEKNCIKTRYFTSFILNIDEAAILFEGLTYFFENDSEGEFLTDDLKDIEKLYKILNQTDEDTFGGIKF